jgi:hypothetical protein
MSKPRITLTEEEAEKVEKLVRILKSAYKSVGVVRRPPGRPGKIEKPIVYIAIGGVFNQIKHYRRLFLQNLKIPKYKNFCGNG